MRGLPSAGTAATTAGAGTPPTAPVDPAGTSAAPVGWQPLAASGPRPGELGWPSVSRGTAIAEVTEAVHGRAVPSSDDGAGGVPGPVGTDATSTADVPPALPPAEAAVDATADGVAASDGGTPSDDPEAPDVAEAPDGPEPADVLAVPVDGVPDDVAALEADALRVAVAAATASGESAPVTARVGGADEDDPAAGTTPAPAGPPTDPAPATRDTAADAAPLASAAPTADGDPAVVLTAAEIAGEEDARRAELAGSLPDGDDLTPLAREVAEDARRRIELHGRPIAAPPRTRVLTVANQKGGVGKTTTTVNVAAALAQAGLRVVVLDSDPQGNASTALGVEHHSDVVGLYDVLVDEVPLEDVLQPCPDVPGLLCAPATIDLAGAEIELVSMVARETRLRSAVQGYLDRLRAAGEPAPDYVFVDCPPSLGLLTLNAFVCAEEVLIPIQCEYYALEGLSQLLKNISMITRHLNPGLHVSSILLTMYDARTRLAAQVAEEVREHFPEQVLGTTVPRSVRVSEAPSYGQTVMTYDPGSSGALSYLAAARELAERLPRASARA